MQALRLHRYNERPTVDEIEEPKVEGPHDVIVKIGGAGLCRTDIHLYLGQWHELDADAPLPYTLGHENAGWVHEVGSDDLDDHVEWALDLRLLDLVHGGPLVVAVEPERLHRCITSSSADGGLP